MLFATAVLAGLVSLAGVHLASRAKSPTTRVHLAVWALSVIPVSLSVCALPLLGHLYRTNSLCGECAEGLLASLVLSMGATALVVASLASALRAVLFRCALRHRLFSAPVHLQRLADELALRAGGETVPLMILRSDVPVAFTWDLLRPRVVLSEWMIENLDPEELEAAVAHEVAHAVSHDCRTIWLATLLRDATFFLPWAWQARRVVVTGKELLADDTAVAVTGRPLALASALAKVWQCSLSRPYFPSTVVLQLSEVGERLEMRVERLLDLEGKAGQGESRPDSLAVLHAPFEVMPPAGLLVLLPLALIVLCTVV